MKVLISTAGSHGDVLPFVALGREFARRGHEVVLHANAYFEPLAAQAGLAFVPIGSVADYRALFGAPSADTPRQAFARIARHLASLWGEGWRALQRDAVAGQTLTIGSSLMFAHRLLRETDGVPCATLHLSPAVFRSNERPARLLPRWIGADSPTLAKRAAWWLLDRTFYDPAFTTPLNRLRAELGLRPVDRIFRSWLHEADCVIGLFPRWFGEPAGDWPAHVQLTGFPFDDRAACAPLPPALQAFIDAGAPPVAFSAGTATASAHGFFRSSVAACRLAGVRGILLSQFDEQVPKALPPDVIHVPYAPFAALLPRLAAFAHHGGIGSTAQALRAGVPQLIRPSAYDQFDNSARAVRLGTAIELLDKDYRPDTVAAALRRLASDERMREHCAAAAARLVEDRSIADSCELMLRRLAQAQKVGPISPA